MPFLLRQFADIYYEQIGTGAETIVLLNGFMRPGSDFKMLARHCEASGFSVVLIDNRGAGQSISYGEFSLEDLADDVAAVLDTLGVKKVNLLGISMGGMIGQLFAIRYPSRVAKIALVSTTADIEWNQKKEFTLQGDQQEVLAQLEDYVAPIFLQKNKMLIHAMAKQMHQNAQNVAFQQAAKQQRQATLSFNCKDKVAGLHMKKLVIHGEEDQVIPVAAGDELATILACPFVKYEGAGHLLLAEKPEQLRRDVLEFFKT